MESMEVHCAIVHRCPQHLTNNSPVATRYCCIAFQVVSVVVPDASAESEMLLRFCGDVDTTVVPILELR